MKILITGSSGYLMSYFRKHFSSTHHEFWVIQKGKAFAIDNNNIYCDLTNIKHIEALKNTQFNFDIIVHAAGYIDINLCKGKNYKPICNAKVFSEIYQQNVLSTANILEFIRYKNINKMLYLSSQTVYGFPLEYSTISEKTPLNPLEHYALSKIMCEQLIELCTSYMNLQSIILRVSGIYGGNRKNGVVYNMLCAAKNKETLQFHIDYHLPIDIVHIDDICNILHKLFFKKYWVQKPQIFNCASGETTNLKLIVDDIFKLTGVKHSLSLKQLPKFRFDNKKIRNFLGVNFTPRYQCLQKEWLKIQND